MSSNDIYYFELLKKSVASIFLKNNNAPTKIEDWKGETIALFQEDLFQKVKATVSEKWFYTYLKKTPEKLPRIDILNLLSKYSNYQNWDDFKAKNELKKRYRLRKTYLTSIIILSLFLIYHFFFTKQNTFIFCFVDQITDIPISKTPLHIKILQDNESPLFYKTDSTGCFKYRSKDSYIKFVVQSPYYKTDTIIRSIAANTNNIVRMASDDYTLMLDYFANNNIKDWNKHKQKLNGLIADTAEIYRFFGGNFGVEVYSKERFIRLLSTPTRTLQETKILDKVIENGKIVKLKFIVK